MTTSASVIPTSPGGWPPANLYGSGIFSGLYPQGTCTLAGFTFCGFGEVVQVSQPFTITAASFSVDPSFTCNPLPVGSFPFPLAWSGWNGTVQGIVFPAANITVLGSQFRDPTLSGLSFAVSQPVTVAFSNSNYCGRDALGNIVVPAGANPARLLTVTFTGAALTPNVPYVVGVTLVAAPPAELTPQGCTSFTTGTGGCTIYGGTTNPLNVPVSYRVSPVASYTVGWTDYWNNAVPSGYACASTCNVWGWNYDPRFDAYFSISGPGGPPVGTQTGGNPPGCGNSCPPAPPPTPSNCNSQIPCNVLGIRTGWLLVIPGVILTALPFATVKRRRPARVG